MADKRAFCDLFRPQDVSKTATRQELFEKPPLILKPCVTMTPLPHFMPSDPIGGKLAPSRKLFLHGRE